MLRILHVEDDLIESMNLRRVFRRLAVDHQLLSVANGEEALRLLNDPAQPKPDIILMDLHMPLMDGFEFLQALRGNDSLRSMAVYVLTSSDLPKDQEFAFRHHVLGYHVKPFQPEHYQEVIRQLITTWESSHNAA